MASPFLSDIAGPQFMVQCPSVSQSPQGGTERTPKSRRLILPPNRVLLLPLALLALAGAAMLWCRRSPSRPAYPSGRVEYRMAPRRHNMRTEIRRRSFSLRPRLVQLSSINYGDNVGCFVISKKIVKERRSYLCRMIAAGPRETAQPRDGYTIQRDRKQFGVVFNVCHGGMVCVSRVTSAIGQPAITAKSIVHN